MASHLEESRNISNVNQSKFEKEEDDVIAVVLEDDKLAVSSIGIQTDDIFFQHQLSMSNLIDAKEDHAIFEEARESFRSIQQVLQTYGLLENTEDLSLNSDIFKRAQTLLLEAKQAKPSELKTYLT